LSNYRKAFIRVLRRRIYTVIALMLCMFICVANAFYLNSKLSNAQYALSGLLRRQNIRLNQLSKAANEKHMLLSAAASGGDLAGNYELINKINETNALLGDLKTEVDTSISALNTGLLITGKRSYDFKKHLKGLRLAPDNISSQWHDLSIALDTVAMHDIINEDSVQSLLFINSKTGQLSEQMTFMFQELIDSIKQSVYSKLIMLTAIFLTAQVLAVVLIIHTKKYIIMPLDAIYTGLSGLNLIKGSLSSSPRTYNELQAVISEINDGFNKLKKLNTLIKTINENISFNDVLKYIYTTFSPFIPYSHIGIALLDDDGKTLEATYGISDKSMKDIANDLAKCNVNIDDTSLSTVIETGKARIINDLEAYTKGRPVKHYNKIILDCGLVSSVALPLKLHNKPIGVIFFSSKTKNVYTNEHTKFLETLADSIAISLNQSIFIDKLMYSSLLALAKLAESRDSDTGAHLERIKIFSEKIADYLLNDGKYTETITPGYIKELKRFSPMHDIGKVGIRDSILLKAGKLTEDEFEEMKKHASFGADVLRTAENNIKKQGKSMFGIGIEIAEGHHERWDGSGYPYGRSSGEIPLSARIVAVADVFDALTSKRSYKDDFSFEISFEMIIKESGRHFDPIIIETLKNHKADLLKVYKSLKQNYALYL
jgi:HD-GYP domain-containing protein (c-di-GMP phosphodiesterase class II)